MRTFIAILLFVYLCNETMGQLQLLSVTAAPIASTTSKSQRDCVFNCPTRTPEYNPICGTDGELYYNPSALECAQRCGINVQNAHRPPPCAPTAVRSWLLNPRFMGQLG